MTQIPVPTPKSWSGLNIALKIIEEKDITNPDTQANIECLEPDQGKFILLHTTYIQFP